MKKILAMLLCCVMVVAMFAGMTVSATTFEELEGYHAYLGCQTCTTLWIFRNAVNDDNYGIGMVHEETGVTAFDGLWSVGAESLYAGTFTDADLNGDGTYTVSLADPDFQDEQYFSLLFVSTNVPLDAGITFSNVKVKVNGKTVWDEEEAFLSPDDKEYCNILLQNQWNNDRKDLFQLAEPCNTTSIEVSFDVSGFGYWAEGQDPADQPAVDTTPAEDTATVTSTDTPATDNTASEGGCTGSVALPALAAVIMAAALLVFKKRA